MPGTSPGMTVFIAPKPRSILDLREIRHRTRGAADLVEQLQAILTHLRIVVVDANFLEERINRRTQLGHSTPCCRHVFLRDSSACLRRHLADRLGQRLLLAETVERGIGRPVERALVLLLLDAENIAGALDAGEQILAVLGLEEFAERLDAA